MPTFIVALNWTEHGIRAVKDSPKRGKVAREIAKKTGVEIKDVYLTSGADDFIVIMESPNADNVAKFAMAISSLGFVRTRTMRAWSEAESEKLISGLP